MITNDVNLTTGHTKFWQDKTLEVWDNLPDLDFNVDCFCLATRLKRWVGVNLLAYLQNEKLVYSTGGEFFRRVKWNKDAVTQHFESRKKALAGKSKPLQPRVAGPKLGSTPKKSDRPKNPPREKSLRNPIEDWVY